MSRFWRWRSVGKWLWTAANSRITSGRPCCFIAFFRKPDALCGHVLWSQRFPAPRLHDLRRARGLCRAVDLHVDLIEVPAASAHPVHTPALDLCGKHRAEPIPPVAQGLVADLDAALVEKVLDVSQGQRRTNVEHHRHADDLWAVAALDKWFRQPSTPSSGMASISPQALQWTASCSCRRSPHAGQLKLTL